MIACSDSQKSRIYTPSSKPSHFSLKPQISAVLLPLLSFLGKNSMHPSLQNKPSLRILHAFLSYWGSSNRSSCLVLGMFELPFSSSFWNTCVVRIRFVSLVYCKCFINIGTWLSSLAYNKVFWHWLLSLSWCPIPSSAMVTSVLSPPLWQPPHEHVGFVFRHLPVALKVVFSSLISIAIKGRI